VKPFHEIEVTQGSDEWLHARHGYLTGSRAADMLSTIRSGEAAARRECKGQLVSEIVTQLPVTDTFVNQAMSWGIEQQQYGVRAYEVRGALVQSSGFLRSHTVRAGCSLDGHVGDFDGIIEVKCPKSTTHARLLQEHTLGSRYLPQVLHNLWITGAQWCDWMSYDPRFPPHLRLHVIRVPRDESSIADYEQKALAFLREVDEEVHALQRRHHGKS
jgi:hypothetical protein